MVCYSFYLYYQFLSCWPQSVGSEEYVRISLVYSVAIERCVQLLHCCPVICQFVSYVMFHLYGYRQKDKNFGLIHVRDQRRYFVKCVQKFMIVMVFSATSSLITSEKKRKHENSQWTWISVYVWGFIVFYATGTTCKFANTPDISSLNRQIPMKSCCWLILFKTSEHVDLIKE
jgi:hypothetical protein